MHLTQIKLPPVDAKKKTATNKSVNFKVNGMHCSGCADKIKRSVGDLHVEHTLAIDVASGKVNIKFENLSSDTKISILDLTGKSIIEKEISTKTSITEFDLLKFPKGIYLVKVMNSENVRIEKIVVE